MKNKSRYIPLLVSIFCLFANICCCAKEENENFNPSMLHLVDSNDRTFLFRGNMPQMNGIFDYSGLTAAMNTILAKQNVVLLSNYRLMDLSFLNKEYERNEIKVEKTWFSVNPQTGSFWLNPLFGCVVDPLFVPKDIRTNILKDYDPDGLKVLMSRMRNLIQQPTSIQFVIYIHCNAGKDRTGEVSACYLMQYKSYSYSQVMALDLLIAQRALNSHNVNAIRWYAFYLRDVLQMDTIGKIQ